jgi:hypothetical protein
VTWDETLLRALDDAHASVDHDVVITTDGRTLAITRPGRHTLAMPVGHADASGRWLVSDDDLARVLPRVGAIAFALERVLVEICDRPGDDGDPGDVPRAWIVASAIAHLLPQAEVAVRDDDLADGAPPSGPRLRS